MKGLLLGALLFLSVQVMAQTKTAAGNTKKAGAKTTATTKKSIAAALAKPIAPGNPVPAKPVADYPADSLANGSTKALNFQYRDSALKYRDLMLYYQQAIADPKDTTAKHYQKIAMYFQKKHIELNKPTIMSNDSVARKNRKSELEKKYNIRLH